MERTLNGTLHVQWLGGDPVVLLVGEHDLATANSVSDVIGQLGDVGHVIVDLREATFVDSAIISILVRPPTAARLTIVIPAGGPVRRTVDLVGLAAAAAVCEDLPPAEALSPAVRPVEPRRASMLGDGA